jgi:hypothetical protein
VKHPLAIEKDRVALRRRGASALHSWTAEDSSVGHAKDIQLGDQPKAGIDRSERIV